MRSSYFDRESRSIISLTAPGELYPGWTINRVSVLPPHRGRGLARKLMAEVLFDADTERVRLYLEVQPDISGTGLTREQLDEWYSRLGFAPSQRFHYPTMMRYPREGKLLSYVQSQQVRSY